MTWFLGFLKALSLSKPLLYALAALAGLGTYEGWKYHQRSIGATEIKEVVREHNDANAKLAEKVRTDFDAGKRGVRGKYQRDD